MENQGKVEGNSSLIRLCMCRQYLMAFHVDVNGYPVKYELLPVHTALTSVTSTWAQLFERRLVLTRVSLSFYQKHSLG